MSSLRSEINERYKTFSSNWKDSLESERKALESKNSTFESSYLRITSLQAWRAELLDGSISDDSISFFLEAQNDALLSHVLAQLGAWRPALQSLRSCIENVFSCLYYMDHPIEMTLWDAGKHKLGFTELYKYLSNHPNAKDVAPSITGLDALKDEYATLSRAVHASSVAFRMTEDIKKTLLWSSDVKRLGSWSTRERRTIRAINLILLAIFHERLQGASLLNLRKAVSLDLTDNQRLKIKSSFKVNLPT